MACLRYGAWGGRHQAGLARVGHRVPWGMTGVPGASTTQNPSTALAVLRAQQQTGLVRNAESAFKCFSYFLRSRLPRPRRPRRQATPLGPNEL